MLDEAAIEKRLTALEDAVSDMKKRLPSANGNWLEKVTGSVSDEQAFLEALAHGRAYRQADRPADDGGTQP